MQCRCTNCDRYKVTERRQINQLPKGKCVCGGSWEQCSWWKDEDGIGLHRNDEGQVFTLLLDSENPKEGKYYEVEQAQRVVTVWVIKKNDSDERKD